MSFLATTRIAVLRAAEPGTSPLGDETYGEQEPVTGLGDLPASIIERTRTAWDQASGTPRRVRVVVCRTLPAGTDPATGERVNFEPAEDDRILDKRTGRIYAIDIATVVARSLAGMTSLTLELRDTTSGLA